jgi:hypothetical protein
MQTLTQWMQVLGASAAIVSACIAVLTFRARKRAKDCQDVPKAN